MLSIEGKKMSKSQGNFVTLKDALNEFGADATRCALLLGGEGMNDPDWRRETVGDVLTKLRGFMNLVDSIIDSAKTQNKGHLEDWLISTLQHRVKIVSENMEVLKTRTALENGFFEIWNDFRWYLRRKGQFNSDALKDALETWIRLLVPFAPYICEEVWSKLGQRDFVSVADWPVYDETKVNVKAEETENLIKNVLEDTANILRATKIIPKEIYYYTPASWKWKVYMKTLEQSSQGKVAIGDLMKELMADPELRKMGDKIAKFVQEITQEINRSPEDTKRKQLQIKHLDENDILSASKVFFEREFNVQLFIYHEKDPQIIDPQNKARFAKPYRPAIYIK